MADREIVRRHFWFSGRVQGVGFRYRAFYIAQALGLSGWVRNSWDERVEMEVQGTREAISEMLIQLREQRFVDIERLEEENIPLEADGWFSIK